MVSAQSAQSTGMVTRLAPPSFERIPGWRRWARRRRKDVGRWRSRLKMNGHWLGALLLLHREDTRWGRRGRSFHVLGHLPLLVLGHWVDARPEGHSAGVGCGLGLAGLHDGLCACRLALSMRKAVGLAGVQHGAVAGGGLLQRTVRNAGRAAGWQELLGRGRLADFFSHMAWLCGQRHGASDHRIATPRSLTLMRQECAAKGGRCCGASGRVGSLLWQAGWGRARQFIALLLAQVLGTRGVCRAAPAAFHLRLLQCLAHS